MLRRNWDETIKMFGQLAKKDGYILLLMLLTVPLAGELKFYPLNETFRVSFGVPTFFFFYYCFEMSRLFCPGF